MTLWDVGVERQIEISGPDAFTFANMMTPRDLNKCAVRQAKYAFITLPDGGIANDPVLMRLEENRFWLSLADSDIGLWASGLAYHSGLDVTIGEVDVAPVQLQGPKSRDVIAGLFGEKILEIPYYGMSEDLELEGMRVCVSRTGYTGELGYEIYLHDATANGTRLWNTVLEAGRPHGLEVTGPCHIRRIEGRHPRVRRRHLVRHQSVRSGHGLPLDGRPPPGGRLRRQASAAAHQGRGPGAQAGRHRNRRAAGRLLHRQRDDRDVPGAARRSSGRPGDLRLLLPAAAEKHRLPSWKREPDNDPDARRVGAPARVPQPGRLRRVQLQA